MEAAMQVEDWMQNEDWFLDPEGTKSWQTGDITATKEDKEVLRTLGEQVAAIASLPVQAETAAKWSTLNDLGRVKPMVWIQRYSMARDGCRRGTAPCRRQGQWSRYHEWELRKLIYQWEHMRADMVIEPSVYSPLVVHSSGVGLAEDVDIAVTDEANSVVSRHFNIQIHDEDDLEKIKIPVVTHDAASAL